MLDPVEAWLDIGELREEMKKLGRLMTAINLIMNEGRGFESFVKAANIKDIWDTLVLRRVRLMQLAKLTCYDRVSMVFNLHGKEIRDKPLKKVRPRIGRKEQPLRN